MLYGIQFRMTALSALGVVAVLWQKQNALPFDPRHQLCAEQHNT